MLGTAPTSAPERAPAHRSGGAAALAVKVPEVGILFWLIKLVTTGIGEATSDFLGNTQVIMAGIVGVAGFALALRRQLRTPEFRAPVYWTAVLMVAVFGTMVADGVHDGAGVSYAVTTAFYALVVAAVLFAWWRSEGTLSVHSITTPRRERFYWGTVLATFALGTAAGDFTAMELNLGFFGSALFFAAVIAVPALLWWRRALNPVAAFWAAYVVTRPLGASFADWFGKPHLQTGLGLGDGTVTAMGLLVFAALVAYASSGPRRRAAAKPHGRRAHGLEVRAAES
jgi:uncharacterized membrane-anchored protein